MNIRTLLIAAGLATLAGCAVGPYWDDEGVYGPGYPVYHDTDSYGGYYYVQIIYIDGEPWYVDDYRRAHPIPPQLRSHFRNSSWTRSLPPRFGHDDDVRDGYRLSRIVYVNDVPVYVDDDRRARPLPERVRSQFRYQGVVTPQPPAYGREREMPPSNGRMQQREMQGPDGRMQQREMPPSNARERERPAPPVNAPQMMPQPPMQQERMREQYQMRPMQQQQVRPAQPPVRDGRGEPPGRPMAPPSDRGTGMGRPVPQESGSKANDGQHGSADGRKSGKPTGRGTGRDDGGQDNGSVKGSRPGE